MVFINSDEIKVSEEFNSVEQAQDWLDELAIKAHQNNNQNDGG